MESSSMKYEFICMKGNTDALESPILQIYVPYSVVILGHFS